MERREAVTTFTFVKNLWSNRKPLLSEYKKHHSLFIMMLPGIIYLLVFHYAPIYGLVLAFKDFKLKAGILGSQWIGFENFERLFSMPTFWGAFGNTLIISFYRLAWGFAFPIILAILLNEVRNAAFKKTMQTITYLPHFVSWVVLSGLFIQLLSPSIGAVNLILMKLGLEPIYFLASPSWFRTVIVSTGIWKEMGWGSVVYLAALSGIDSELYEAADIDGAGRISKIINISLPSLAPVITVILIFDVGKILNDNFDQIYNLLTTPVERVGEVLSTYMYKVGLKQMEYSLSTAMGLFKNVISFTLVIAANNIAKRINEYGIW